MGEEEGRERQEEEGGREESLLVHTILKGGLELCSVNSQERSGRFLLSFAIPPSHAVRDLASTEWNKQALEATSSRPRVSPTGGF